MKNNRLDVLDLCSLQLVKPVPVPSEPEQPSLSQAAEGSDASVSDAESRGGGEWGGGTEGIYW